MKSLPILAGLVLAAPAGAEPLELFDDRPFIAITINGQRATALLDSAAEMTMLDDDFAGRLGLVATGGATAHGSGAAAMEARFADHVAIVAVGAVLDRRVAILDLGEVSARLLGRDVDMLLGRDLFDAARLRIDYRAGTIAPFDGAPRGVRLPVGEHRGVPTFPASVDGRDPVEAVFDTGNGSDVLVGRAYAERVGLTAPERIVDRSAGGGLGGARQQDVVVLRELRVAGRTFRNVRAVIDPGASASDLNIGTSILRHFHIVTDFPNRSIWLEPIP